MFHAIPVPERPKEWRERREEGYKRNLRFSRPTFTGGGAQCGSVAKIFRLLTERILQKRSGGHSSGLNENQNLQLLN